MGQAKNRGSQKERIEAAKLRQKAIRDRMRGFAQEVGKFQTEIGLEMGAVKLDGRFVIVKFDDLVEFIKRRPPTDAEVMEDLKPREKEKEIGK